MNGNWAADLFGVLVAGAESNNFDAETDYVGDDGRKYCSKCHTPKESILAQMNGRKIPCMCKCQMNEYLASEKEKREVKRNARIRMLGEKFVDATFDNAMIVDDNKKVMEICRRYSESFEKMQEMNQGLLLMGSSGTGKTYAASCIVNALLDKGKRCMVVNAVDMAKELNAFAKDGATEYEDRLTRADLLVIDDFGAERSTKFSTERMYKAINIRYLSGKPLILTTNITSSAAFFEDATQEQKRIYDRLFENCTPVSFTGKSWRVRMASRRAKNLSAILGLEEE